MTSRNPSQIKDEIEKANQQAVERMMESDPVWVEMGLARKVIPGMKEKMLLHAGPPIEWDRMAGPMKGAVMGAAIYEGWSFPKIFLPIRNSSRQVLSASASLPSLCKAIDSILSEAPTSE